MATGFFTLLDDATVISKCPATKCAAKKTAGMLGDDLAVHARKATGLHTSERIKGTIPAPGRKLPQISVGNPTGCQKFTKAMLYKRLYLILFLLVSPPLLAVVVKSTDNPPLFQLQSYKQEDAATYTGKPVVQAALLNLNRQINQWYLLSADIGKGDEILLNLLPVSDRLRLRLDPAEPLLLIGDDQGQDHACAINEDIIQPYRNRASTKLSYLSVCDDRLLVTIKQDGYQPALEKGARMVRWLTGNRDDASVNEAKTSLSQDKRIETAPPAVADKAQEIPVDTGGPPSARLDPGHVNTGIPTDMLGLKIRDGESRLLAGQWYPLRNFPAVYASLIEPGMVSKEILASHRDRVNRLDGEEDKSVVHLMAINLSHYTLGWGHGTDHPGVGWSERAVNIKKDNPLGPDGFNTLRPLITLGHVPPFLWSRTIGTFSGGFQNSDSAFRYGELAKTNKAHPYGFMENGLMMSSPTEGLATVIMYQDASVEMKRWGPEDQEKLPQIRHLRQNGVPLIERDDQGRGIPGKWVRYWGPGNWHGSANGELRTPRGGACLIETPEDQYFVYAYFSAITPSGMARVFQAYGCSFALQLDLNSPGQSYAALFTPGGKGTEMDIELLQDQMGLYMGANRQSPRYFLKPDYKDFFYILRRD